MEERPLSAMHADHELSQRPQVGPATGIISGAAVLRRPEQTPPSLAHVACSEVEDFALLMCRVPCSCPDCDFYQNMIGETRPVARASNSVHGEEMDNCKKMKRKPNGFSNFEHHCEPN